MTLVNKRGTNHLLSLLGRADRERVMALCERREFALAEPIYEIGGTIDHVYFPLSGVISLVLGSPGGATIEVAVVGNEGFAGAPAALGSDHSDVRAVVQCAGEFLRMGIRDFRAELARGNGFASTLQRSVQVLFSQVSQSVLCNRVHTVEERTCRWLLMAHDRAGTPEMQLTQQFIAEMLGIRRASVTVAAGLLQKKGHIRYLRGKVTIVDRAGLQQGVCECYETVNRVAARLLVR